MHRPVSRTLTRKSYAETEVARRPVSCTLNPKFRQNLYQSLRRQVLKPKSYAETEVARPTTSCTLKRKSHAGSEFTRDMLFMPLNGQKNYTHHHL